MDAVTWTVYYYVIYAPYPNLCTFKWGTTTYNSRIEGFNWSSGTVKQWHDMDFFNITTKQWNPIDSLTLQILTKKWQNISQWNLNLIVYGWHNISILTFTITTEITRRFPFIIIVTGIIILAIAYKLVSK
ncbi:MAG: hypothetical protein QW270_06685 [Candidatus Bathyarchaeia archaeon]